MIVTQGFHDHLTGRYSQTVFGDAMSTSINRLLQAIEDHASAGIHLYGAYLQVWYYVEILYMMGVFLVVYGKGLAFLWGIVLAVLLSVHIIRFYFRKETSRRVQLVLMDLHVAYSVSLMMSLMQGTTGNTMPEMIIMMVRLVITAMEVYLIWLLTGDAVKKKFDGLERL